MSIELKDCNFCDIEEIGCFMGANGECVSFNIESLNFQEGTYTFLLFYHGTTHSYSHTVSVPEIGTFVYVELAYLPLEGYVRMQLFHTDLLNQTTQVLFNGHTTARFYITRLVQPT